MPSPVINRHCIEPISGSPYNSKGKYSKGIVGIFSATTKYGSLINYHKLYYHVAMHGTCCIMKCNDVHM